MTRRAGGAAVSRRLAAGLGVAAALGLAACSGAPAPSRPASTGPASTGPASTGPASTGPAAVPAPARTGPESTSPAGSASPARPDDSGGGGFTVSGRDPVPPNGSQDTAAQAAGISCDTAKMASYQRTGDTIALGFSVAGLSAAADLLRHFLAGAGTPVSYPAESQIAGLARTSAAFASVNRQVQAEVARQLRAGGTRVLLSAAQLPTVPFNAAGGDLYWGFRGTQGLSVTGHGQRQGGAYTGTLSYVIGDSYGFPAGDTLGGFGAPMRYLQTVCGAPQHQGGAHWFPDTITVTVPFRQPA
jgi:hypothetical protein